MRSQINPVEGEMVRIESFREEWITERYSSWLRDESIHQFLVSGTKNTTLDEIAAYVKSLEESEKDCFLALLDKKTGVHIGNVRLQFYRDTGKGQYSMMIGDSSYHGKGLGTEVVRLVLQICFTQLGLNKVFCEVVADNLPAVRVYAKNGFVVEKRLKDHFSKNGRLHDILVMGVHS